MVIKNPNTKHFWKALGFTPEQATEMYRTTAAIIIYHIVNTSDKEGDYNILFVDLVKQAIEKYKTDEEHNVCLFLVMQHVASMGGWGKSRIEDDADTIGQLVKDGKYEKNTPELYNAILEHITPATANVAQDDEVQEAEVVSGPDQKLIPEKV